VELELAALVALLEVLGGDPEVALLVILVMVVMAVVVPLLVALALVVVVVVAHNKDVAAVLEVALVCSDQGLMARHLVQRRQHEMAVVVLVVLMVLLSMVFV